MNSWMFEIPGPAVGKGRPRFGNGRAFTDSKTVAYENLVALEAQARNIPWIEGNVKVDVVVAKQLLKTMSKKKRALALAGVYASSKPDLDNVLKSILDGLNGVIYRDDSQVVAMSISRIWTELASKVIVSVTEIK
jgi:Holliday junction resolvase RusA-like endonuclease